MQVDFHLRSPNFQLILFVWFFVRSIIYFYQPGSRSWRFFILLSLFHNILWISLDIIPIISSHGPHLFSLNYQELSISLIFISSSTVYLNLMFWLDLLMRHMHDGFLVGVDYLFHGPQKFHCFGTWSQLFGLGWSCDIAHAFTVSIINYFNAATGITIFIRFMLQGAIAWYWCLLFFQMVVNTIYILYYHSFSTDVVTHSLLYLTIHPMLLTSVLYEQHQLFLICMKPFSSDVFSSTMKSGGTTFESLLRNVIFAKGKFT